MANKDPGISWRHVMTVIVLAVATVMVLTVPAWAHPVFSNDEPGFPNPLGGTGGPGQTPPYPAGSRPALNMFLPFEQDGVVFHGAENTTVDVRVTIPAAWANPACGPARTSPPVGYRQLGTVVGGWSCAVATVSGHQVLHWTGTQVSAAQTHDDSAQFFTFQATMPSPVTNTSYGAPGGPEGVHVKQVYADGATSLWTPPNDPPSGQIAPGMVRTVAAATAPPPPSAAPKPGTTAPGGTTPGNAQGATMQGAVTHDAATPSSPPPAAAQHKGGDLADPPPVGAPATGPQAAAGAPGAETVTTTEASPSASSPGVQSPPPSVEQLTQRNTATSHGLGWPGWVGITLAVVLVAGAVATVIKRRQRAA